jgi:amino acid adenylation domain-containing protein
VTAAVLAGSRRSRASTPKRLDALFAAQAAATPEAIAVLCRGEAVSYRALDQRSNRLAHHLADLGVGPGALVGVCMRRSPELVVALLGVLKAGGAYLPLDPDYPVDRLDFMLGDSAAAVLLTDVDVHARLAFHGAVVDPVRDAATIAARCAEPPAVPYHPDDLAYVIYTSGSTGRPKGVMLGHSATGLIAWARTAFTDGELARVAAATSVCFDPSVFEIFAPICTGGTAVLKANALEPFTPDERPTLLNCVPSVLAELCRARAVPDSVRAINIGGEPLTAAFVREVYRSTRVRAVYNHYGPTEATTCTTVALAPPDIDRDPPIGRPIAGAKVHVLDEAGRPVRLGEVGEIHIGGPVLARGYLNRPDLTAERFVEGRLGPRGGRLYRTGDLGRWQADGQLEFVGRVDQQVKLRGFRVELGEVESALSRLPAVRGAVAAVRPDRAGRPQLVAWVETNEPLSLREVRSSLAAWLPEPLLPRRLVTLAAFPLTLSGKVDRNALPEPEFGTAPEPIRRSEPASIGLSRVEEAIAETFRDVLKLDQVGPEDSFFELGGDSLSGVEAALRLEELLGHPIPSALLHQATTARALAEALEHCASRQDRCLSLLRSGGAGAPLVCLADLFGRPFSYLSLARRLAPERPVWGLSPGPQEAAFLDKPSISALTRAHFRALREAQPHGPYLLAGYSAGGLLAFDLACALEREGEPVSLVLLDAAIRRRPPAGALLRLAAGQARALLEPAKALARLRRLWALRDKLVRAAVPVRLQRPPEWVPNTREAYAQALMRAHVAHTPGAFQGPTLVVKCRERDPIDALYDRDGLLSWRDALKGPVTVAEVAGDHHGFMREPCVAEVAAAVARFADGVGQGTGQGI